jgi:hypothetical protein
MTLQESFVVGGKAGKCSICAKLYDTFKVKKVLKKIQVYDDKS